MEIVADEKALFLKQIQGTLTHEEYRTYEALNSLATVLLDLNDYLYASRERSEKVIVYIK